MKEQVKIEVTRRFTPSGKPTCAINSDDKCQFFDIKCGCILYPYNYIINYENPNDNSFIMPVPNCPLFPEYKIDEQYTERHRKLFRR